jgi:PPOX class probable F420-dependent enzyme
MASIPDSHRDLLAADVAVLGTVGPDGRPQTSAVWFLAEGDTVRLSLNSARQKLKSLQANRGCSLLILDLQNPYRYLELRGDADVVPDDDLSFARKLGAKYDTEFWVHDGPGETRNVVTINPVRVHGVDMSG